MSAARARPRLVEAVLFATILLDFAGFSILIPVLPLYARDLGASEVEVGLLLSLYSLGLVVFLPFWGWVSDRVGRRPVILICLLGTAAYFALLAIARTVGEIYAARALGGFFGASIGTAQAYMTDITHPEDRARGMGMIGAAFGVGFVLGNVLGGALQELSPSLPFIFTAGLALANFAIAAWLLPEPRGLRSPPVTWSGLARALVPTPLQFFSGSHERRTRLYLYLFFHVFASFSALEAMFPLYASETFDWGALDIGLFLAYVGIVVGATQGFLIGRLARLYSEASLVGLGLACTGASMALLPAAHSLGALLALGTAIAFGNGVAFPAFTSLFSKVCSGEEAGELLGHGQSMAQTGRALGPYWAGWAMGTLGAGAPLLLGGLGMLAALAIFVANLSLLAHRPPGAGPPGVAR